MFERILYCDTETYSETPIKNGTYRYAEDAEVLLFAYAVDDGDISVWDRTAEPEMPTELRQLLMDQKTLTVWHNSMFDRSVIRYALGIDLATRRIHDTMVIAYMHGLVGGLDKLCDVFKLSEDESKNKDGKKLIQLFCKPRPKSMKLRRATRKTHPEEWSRFVEYARMDIMSMRVLYKKLPKWNVELEHPIWCLDQKINDRGFNVDLELVEGAIESVAHDKDRMADRTKQITGGGVESATQRDKLIQHILKQYGVSVPDMTKSTLERRINDPELPEPVRELLQIRLEASATAVSKYKKLRDGVNNDGRLRGTLQFSGASRTARWAGRTFQPQNLPRASFVTDEDVEKYIPVTQAGCLHLISDRVAPLTSAMIRGCIIPTEGRKLCVADLSNIEGRVAAWLTGEDWKIKAFEDFDAGEGADLYKLAYSRAFGTPPDEVTKYQRLLGKVQELALGYQGGVGAFVSMVMVYGIDLDDMTEQVYDTLPSDILREAENFWSWSGEQKRTYDLSEKVFITCDSLKRMWRRVNFNISSYWTELENAVVGAVSSKGKVFTSGRLSVVSDGVWLKVKLPSGRFMCYPSAKLDKDGKLSYLGVNTYTRQWGRIGTYGGKLFENVCQAVARDVMAYNMQMIEDAGYHILLTVHDELITETSPTLRAEGLAELMATNPEWASGLPLAASGFEADRYRKD